MQELVTRWAKGGRRLLNTYGPTETTVVATWTECTAGVPITIGRALPGYHTHVLNEQLQPVGAGEEGELFIGGDAVAPGYLNQPELTAERFIASPFAGPGTRLYRTHDLVRLGQDGALQFLGRIDGQVKIRGFRVELSEIETVLMQFPGIKAAAVRMVSDAGLPELAAYAVLDEADTQLDRAGVAEMLRTKLPDYMIPKYLDIVEHLPVLTSGKVDRKQLPAPLNLLKGASRDVVAPESDIECVMVQAWEKCLQVSPVSVEDDFFLDLSGHSLLAARVVTELRTRLGTSRISVRDLYKFRTIRAMSARLQQLGIAAQAPAAADTATDRDPGRAGLCLRAGLGALDLRRAAGNRRGGVLRHRRSALRLLGARDHERHGRQHGARHRAVAHNRSGVRLLAGPAGIEHRPQVAGDRALPAGPVSGVEPLLFPLVAGEPLPGLQLGAHVRRHAADGPLLSRDGRQGRPQRDDLDGLLLGVRPRHHRRAREHRRRDAYPGLSRRERHALHRPDRHRARLLRRHPRLPRAQHLDGCGCPTRRHVGAGRRHASAQGRRSPRIPVHAGRGGGAHAGRWRARASAHRPLWRAARRTDLCDGLLPGARGCPGGRAGRVRARRRRPTVGRGRGHRGRAGLDRLVCAVADGREARVHPPHRARHLCARERGLPALLVPAIRPQQHTHAAAAALRDSLPAAAAAAARGQDRQGRGGLDRHAVRARPDRGRQRQLPGGCLHGRRRAHPQRPHRARPRHDRREGVHRQQRAGAGWLPCGRRRAAGRAFLPGAGRDAGRQRQVAGLARLLPAATSARSSASARRRPIARRARRNAIAR